MNRNLYLLIVLLLGSSFISCKKSDISHESDYDKSYKSWVAFKTSSNNSYRYKVSFTSWTGYSTETVITVKAGQVVGRSYVAKTVEHPSNSVLVREEWTEDESTLNTHANGDPSATLDEIYDRAKNQWLLKRKDAEVYLETKNNGMISSCGFVPKNCADDCFRGIHISLIEAYK